MHRDLKPSNVLVTISDNNRVPKVIDFGVAKAINHQLTDETLYTQYGTVIGTLEYMSPEQAEMSGLDIDTRSDVYSLGVLLYQLLTGATPLALERRKMKRPAYHEILRRIREEEPPRPSARVAASRETLHAIAAHRKVEPARLTKLLRGELDWIVMKAIEKERTRRYDSASDFARDVERYLKDEPVEAGSPPPMYRLGKFARKHKTLLANSGGFALLLIAATILSAWLAIRASSAERAATARASELQTVSHFLQDDVLGEPATRDNPANVNFTYKEFLDRAAASVEGRFDQQPAIEASIRRTIGELYWRIGEDSHAQSQLEMALVLSRAGAGENGPESLRVKNALALVYLNQGKHEKAETLLKSAYEFQRKAKGDDDPETLTTLSNLALLYQDWSKLELAEPLFRRLSETQVRKLGSEHRDRLATENNLAIQDRAR